MKHVQLTITKTAGDPKKGMTVGEMEAFVAEAKSADIAPDTPVAVRTGWRGQITSLTAETSR